MQGVNACGAGSYSTAGFFYTGALHCRDSQLAIPDTGFTLDAMVIHDPGTIVDLDVWLKVSHSYVGDLEFALKHPGSATQIRLIDRPGVPATQYGCSSDDIDAILDEAIFQWKMFVVVPRLPLPVRFNQITRWQLSMACL